MSFDLYLLPAVAVDNDPDNARTFLDREESDFTEIPIALDLDLESRKRRLADCFLRLKPSYSEFQVDYAAIANYENIKIDEARRKYRYIELNGSDDPPEAQVVISDRYVVIHWHSGTSPEDMDAIVAVLSYEGDFVLYDPQADQVLDPRKGSILDGLEP